MHHDHDLIRIVPLNEDAGQLLVCMRGCVCVGVCMWVCMRVCVCGSIIALTWLMLGRREEDYRDLCFTTLFVVVLTQKYNNTLQLRRP